MGAIALAANALASLGRQGTRAVAISIFLSLIVPQVSEFIRPAVGPSIFIMLVLAFLRVEPSALHGQFTGRPFRLLLTSVAVMMVATPLILGALYAGMGDTPAMRGLYVALILQAAAPPIMSAPAFVALLALDLPLALATLVLAILFTPIGAPFFAAIFVGDDLPIDALSLALRLAFFLGGSFLVARVLRRFIGDERIRAWREHIDGLNLIALFVFALAIMGVVTYTLLSDPLLVLLILVLSFAIAFAIGGVTTAIFWAAGGERALTLGISAGMRNMGLMLAATAGVADTTLLYFAVAQIPIYLAPWLLQPIVQRILPSRLPPGQ